MTRALALSPNDKHLLLARDGRSAAGHDPVAIHAHGDVVMPSRDKVGEDWAKTAEWLRTNRRIKLWRD